MTELCSRCRRTLRKHPDAANRRSRRYDAGNEVLRALSNGPRNLKQIARGVYGDDSPASRRKAAAVLQTLGDAVEVVPDLPKCSGVWRLAYAHQQHQEAAE